MLVAILLVHAAAAAPALLLHSLGPGWRLLWLAAVLTELVLTLRRHHSGFSGAPGLIGRDGSGSWWLKDGAGRRWQGELRDRLVHPGLCVLRFGRGPGARTVVVPADACSPEQHRRLRAALLEHGAGEHGGQASQ
ncbi:protein YgfX [Spiribacter halobius]|uniref:Uncharacterized protein n=1 Tax=Sediminicurvatus halobius TaxID=2182432 RepID=A0A2U2N3I7_9GAMM|nr:protein YgfX [Spiribacter halobius]PWG63756.1 hypothetical protein DEM34_07720 [Spiribacter halobius]UEX76237.1 hypothetical protein LMH63_09680 [Spiribacter halobius]